MNDYILKQSIHIYDTRLLTGFDIIEEIKQGLPADKSPQCMVMWIKSLHAHFMPWIPIPCNAIHVVDFIICEHTHRPNNSSTSFNEQITVLSVPKLVCPKYWTYILDHCYKVYEWGTDVIFDQGMERVTGFHSGINTSIDEWESEKALLYRFLQDWVFSSHIQESYPKSKRPVQLKINGHCAFLELTATSNIIWYYRTDCVVHAGLSHSIFRCINQRAELNHRSDMIFYYEINTGVRGRCEFVPYGCNMSLADNRKVQLASYLAKSSESMRQDGIAVSIGGKQCVISYPTRAGNPPEWHVAGNLTNCTSARYRLVQSSMISESNKTSRCSRSNHIQCDDGTCVVLNRRCDGISDCPDGSDEQNCLPACVQSHTTAKTSCFENCVIPNCSCTFLYDENSQLGACQPMWSTNRSFTENVDKIQENPWETDRLYVNDLHHPSYAQSAAFNTIQSSSEILPTDVDCIFQKGVHEQALNLRYCYQHKCPGMYKCYYSYCIPYRYVCDGWSDCPSGEEEDKCNKLICPGLLKCALDNVCISHSEVCDGNIHCIISKDDEWMCDLPECPEHCICIGMTLTCRQQNLTDIPIYHGHIKALALPGNTIKSLSHDLNAYQQLLKVDLSQNHICRPNTGSFQNLLKLRHLYLDKNPLATIKGGCFLGLLSVDEVTFELSHIYSIRRYGFSGLQKVKVLDISNINLREVRPFAFTGVYTVVMLDMSDNYISYLREFVFSGLASITLIDLSNNPLVYLEPGVFSQLKHLSKILTNYEGVCCFVPHPVYCSSQTLDHHASCKHLISRRLVRYLAGFPSFAILISNALPFFIVARSISKSKQRSRRIMLYLPLMDFALAIYILMLLMYDHNYGESFVLLKRSWLQGTECQVLHALASFSISGSSMSILIIVSEWFIAVYFPFKMNAITETLHHWLDIYLGWPIATTILRCRFFQEVDELCFPYGPINYGTTVLVLHTLLFSLESFVFTIPIIQAVLIIYYVQQSRRYTKRKWSKKDTRLLYHLAAISVNNLIRWACLLIQTILALIMSNNYGTSNEYILFFILPVNSIITPLVFTLSTRASSHTISRHPTSHKETKSITKNSNDF